MNCCSLKGEYVMPTLTKCFVEIFFIQNNFISFDFGDFAIVIEYCRSKKVDEFHRYLREDYHKKFMDVWGSKIGFITNSVEISLDEFKQIQVISNCNPSQVNMLWNFLKKIFQKQIRNYGR